MNSGDSPSGDDSISQGPSERFERWGQGWRRSVYRAWPPTATPTYPVSERCHRYQNMVCKTIGGSSSNREPDWTTITDDDLKARWQQAAEQKVEVHTLRCRIERAKSRVEQARQERDAADNDFMSALRPAKAGLTSLSASASTERLQKQFQRMQEARDAYQHFEMDLANLQDNLMETQDEIDFLERKLINGLRHLLTREDAIQEEPKIQVPEEQLQSDLLKGLEIEPSNVANPLYQRLLRALCSFGLARRRCVDLLARKARLDEQKRLLVVFEKYHPEALRYVVPLPISDLEFLDHWEMHEKRIAGEMGAWRKEVERLTQLCWGRNLIPQYTTLEYVQSWYPDDFSIDHDLGHDQGRAASTEPIDFSILLSNPSNLFENFPITAEASLKRATRIPEGHPHRATAMASAAKELTIQNLLSDAEDTPNFINRWLLQSLRTSRLQIGALYSSYLARGHSGIFDIEKWQWDILRKWWEDEDNMRSLEYFKPAQTSYKSALPSPPSWLSEPVLYTWTSDIPDSQFEMTEIEHSDATCEDGSQEQGRDFPIENETEATWQPNEAGNSHRHNLEVS